MARKPLVLEFDPVRHAYTLNGLPVPSVTRVISPLNEFSTFIREGTLAKAAERGTAVHFATELHDQAFLDDLAGAEPAPTPDTIWRPEEDALPAVRPYLGAWRRFLADTAFEVHEIEARTFSSRHRYAGTIDRLGVLNGQRCVIDIKTTSAIGPQVGIQLAAYQAATNEHRPAAERYRKRFACQLRPDGSYRLEEFRDPADWSVFLALLQLHNWRLRYRKGRE